MLEATMIWMRSLVKKENKKNKMQKWKKNELL